MQFKQFVVVNDSTIFNSLNILTLPLRQSKYMTIEDKLSGSKSGMSFFCKE